jgi:hypothetical protein
MVSQAGVKLSAPDAARDRELLDQGMLLALSRPVSFDSRIVVADTPKKTEYTRHK